MSQPIEKWESSISSIKKQLDDLAFEKEILLYKVYKVREKLDKIKYTTLPKNN
ncbi:hypothetical protein [Chondrinema litorale]|uniref:hypothetical protein n=1 Tax=Chondrinema litorale TaxID=2994555 RepID=UPI0025435741|nr:hypothetical protein [Chondrinema litorale]UZR95433.1 hypothetical protein OQ292_06350 [Chondrinema litorale]|tara:strand:+ start:580 stop:738 length:159 start_codon:yes stop_codon:yes gene_type:complete